jgi:competence protein ComEA
MAFQTFMTPAALKRACLAVALLVFASACTALEVNTANEAELDSMRGLGPDSTARILKAREAGPFADWPDLMRRVKGIKQAAAQKLYSQGLTVNGQALESLPKQAAPSPTP